MPGHSRRTFSPGFAENTDGGSNRKLKESESLMIQDCDEEFHKTYVGAFRDVDATVMEYRCGILISAPVTVLVAEQL